MHAIDAGDDFILAVKSDRTVWGWGGNASGPRRQGHARSAPIRLSGLADIVAVSGGYQHGLALKSDGSVWAWGSNAWGQVGSNSANSLRPREVQGLPHTPEGARSIKSINAATYNSSVVYADGSVWTWGSNLAAQYGASVPDEARKPIQVNAVAGVGAVASGTGFGVVLSKDGHVHGVGANHVGQLGNNTRVPARVPVSGGWPQRRRIASTLANPLRDNAIIHRPIALAIGLMMVLPSFFPSTTCRFRPSGRNGWRSPSAWRACLPLQSAPAPAPYTCRRWRSSLPCLGSWCWRRPPAECWPTAAPARLRWPSWSGPLRWQ